MLTTDVSEKAISAVLSQDNPPVLYLLWLLLDAERKYSNIKRETLASVRQFLLGRDFKFETDHHPLEFLFDTNEYLPKVTSARILCWAIQLHCFDFSRKVRAFFMLMHYPDWASKSQILLATLIRSYLFTLSIQI